MQSATTNFEYLYDEDSYATYHLESLVDELLAAVGDSTKIILENNLKIDLIRENALGIFNVNNMTIEDYEAFYLVIGLTDKSLDKVRLNKAMEDGWGNLYSSLDATNIHFWIDNEEIDGTSEFDYFIEFFKSSSLGALEDLSFTLDKSYDDEYEYLAVLDGTGYRMDVGEREVWDYRIIEDMCYFINFILETGGNERSFHLFNYNEYLFSTTKQLRQMEKKFGIAESY